MNLVFDLDNTIYHPDVGVLNGVDKNINRYMYEVVGIDIKRVDSLRQEYRRKYGVTLKGLILHHNVDPYHYLDYVHNIDYENILSRDEDLSRILLSIPFKKYIFTNGSKSHAVNVLKNLDVIDYFEQVISIEDIDFHPKPSDESFIKFIMITKLEPKSSYFIDDMPENIEKAKEFGFKTILVSKIPCESADFCIKSIHELDKIIVGTMI